MVDDKIYLMIIKKFQMLIHNLVTAFKTRIIKNNKDEENIIHEHPQSDALERKLALLIKNIEAVDQVDLKQVEYKKIKQEVKNNLFPSFRLDFHTRIELDLFKKKYKSLLL